ncbi:sigma 54-interacting transcriptional regulator [Desulfovibrio aminophilus]|uniref:sigma-54 interaction domain-containing protein n=1 Tax=Desulfovibrio aminophilus TaxID=81425 RepID=UPI0033950166
MTEEEINLHLREIINTMNDGMMLVRPDGSIMMANDALSRITGYTREELMDQPCSVLGCDVCRKSRAEGRAHWCRLFDTMRETLKSCHLKRKDGTLAHVLKNAAILQDSQGRAIGAVETVTDISELDKRDLKIRELSRILDAEEGFQGLIGRSPAMRRVYEILERAAQSDAPVIILGESGTGKELAARAIHALGPRRDGPFVQINCAAFNDALLESEIFGHVKGAFTGAYRHRTGRFEEAAGGDVFLDEVGDVPLPIQVKLLRVLETKLFERVGDNRPLTMDARIITATNQNLPELVAVKRFRQDFFYRINVLPIHLPPLRERREDIPLLVDHFIRRLNRTSGRAVEGLTPDALDRLARHSWPGNVRELKSALEYAFVVCDKGLIGPEHLPQQIAHGAAGTCAPDPAAIFQEAGAPREKVELVEALRRTGGNKSAAARILGVNRLTVQNRMRKYGLDMHKVVTE